MADGALVLPQISLYSHTTPYLYTGTVKNAAGTPLQHSVLAISYEDSALVGSTTSASSGAFSFSVSEPCYIVSLPVLTNQNGVGHVESL